MRTDTALGDLKSLRPFELHRGRHPGKVTSVVADCS